MGRRIALRLATGKGIVRVVDSSPEALTSAKKYIESALPGLSTTEKLDARNVAYSDELESAVQDAWLITEAIPEKLPVKQQLFKKLDRIAPQDAILATNSSSFASSELIDGVIFPERVVNTHYLMPPDRNAVEVMSCGKTDPAVIDLIIGELPKFGFHPFRVHNESRGFIFNRIWAAIKREALLVLAEGVSTPADIDRIFELSVLTNVGPLRMMDVIGLDVVLDIEEHYAAVNPSLPEAPRRLLQEYVGKGWLGVKTGRGFYEYAR